MGNHDRFPHFQWLLGFSAFQIKIATFFCVGWYAPVLDAARSLRKSPRWTWNFSSESWFSESRRACDDGHSRDLATSSRSTEVLLQVIHISSQQKTTIYLPKWWIFRSHLSFPKDFTTFSPAALSFTAGCPCQAAAPSCRRCHAARRSWALGSFRRAASSEKSRWFQGFFLGRSWEDDWNIRYIMGEFGEWWMVAEKKQQPPKKDRNIQSYWHRDTWLFDVFGDYHAYIYRF